MEPTDRKYTKDHEWAKLDEGLAAVGITDYAQEQLGDIVYVELPQLGDTVGQADTFGIIESVKAASDLFAPISGEVVAVNEDLVDRPELVNENPYEGGWMVKLQPEDEAQMDELLTAEEYAAHLKDLE
ncbi:MAG TPA: glycine cleavage system protein GcvH [Anaerolineae bacterium]|nr:glycine cleavage system protein GcvH [Anaerolineae bacterium]